MVNIVQNYSSDYGDGYRETNQELAKENSELRHQLHLRDEEFRQYRQEILDKDLIILDLRRKLDAISDIIIGEKSVQSVILPLPSNANANANSTTDQNESVPIQVLNRISERSEPPDQADSLDPPDVTSVPTLQPERILHTPSIWNILDSSDNLSSPIRPKGRDMLQSTPKNKPEQAITGTPKAKRQKRQKEQQENEIQPQRYNLRNRRPVHDRR